MKSENMFFVYFMFMLLLLSNSAYGNDLIIGMDGKSQCFIEISDTAALPEQRAARELQAYLKKVIGDEPQLHKEGDKTSGPRIVVGHTAFTRDHGIDVDGLGEGEWIIRTIGGSLVLTGGRPCGSLYAVSRFLEDVVGVHWWNSWEESVPSNPNLKVADQKRHGKPVFSYRYPNPICGKENMDVYNPYGPPGSCHTFFTYVPPKEYFATHPEYFSLINGKRVGEGHTQLCLSNPELRKLFISKLKQYIEQGEAGAAKRGVSPPFVHDISHNDWGGHCQCDACRAIVQREGSEGGLYLDFLNEIADSVRQSNPKVYILTLAYGATEKIPRHIKARDNIIIRLCDTWSNATFPITHPANRNFRDLVQGWSRAASRLWIWDYMVIYRDSCGLPYPSADTYAEDFRFYAENKVDGVYATHGFPILADACDFKLWMMGKTLENPYRDYNELAATFAHGFYGKAGRCFLQYLALLRQSQDKHHAYIATSPSPWAFKYLDLETVLAAHKLFDEGENIIAGDPVLERRWHHARLPLDRATYILHRELVRQWWVEGHELNTFPLNRGAVMARVRNTWEEQIAMRIAEPQQHAERIQMENELAKYSKQLEFPAIPEKFRDIPRNSFFDFTAELFRNTTGAVKMVKDPEAESGITNCLDFPNTGGGAQGVEKYQQSMEWGIYSVVQDKFMPGESLKLKDVPGPGYHWYNMGSVSIGPSYDILGPAYDTILKTDYISFFSDRILQIDVGSAYDKNEGGYFRKRYITVDEPNLKFDVWARIKFEGSAFPHGKAEQNNAIFIERVVLIREFSYTR